MHIARCTGRGGRTLSELGKAGTRAANNSLPIPPACSAGLSRTRDAGSRSSAPHVARSPPPRSLSVCLGFSPRVGSHSTAGFSNKHGIEKPTALSKSGYQEDKKASVNEKKKKATCRHDQPRRLDRVLHSFSHSPRKAETVLLHESEALLCVLHPKPDAAASVSPHWLSLIIVQSQPSEECTLIELMCRAERLAFVACHAGPGVTGI
jgi:hypothetical protein